MNLLQMLLASENGTGVKKIQRQFDLNDHSTRDVMQSLVPALSHALRRSASNGEGAAALVQALANGQHGRYNENVDHALSEAGQQEGKAILGHLFGSKDVSRAIATHAAARSNVSETTIKQMLPAIAAMVMGGLSKQAMPNPQNHEPSATSEKASLAGGGIVGEIMEQLTKGGLAEHRNMNKKKRSRKTQASGDILGDILGQVLGGNPSQPRSRSGNDSEVLSDIFESVVGGKKRGRSQAYPIPGTGVEQDNLPQPSQEADSQFEDLGPVGRFEDIGAADEPETEFDDFSTDDDWIVAEPKSHQREKTGLEDLFGDMLDAGNSEDKTYNQGIESIFKKYLGS